MPGVGNQFTYGAGLKFNGSVKLVSQGVFEQLPVCLNVGMLEILLRPALGVEAKKSWGQ